MAGRVTRSLQATELSPAGSRAVEYQYWASDRVKKTKYPSGREVVECLDGRLRVLWASGVKTEGDCSSGNAVAAVDAYVTGAEYAAHGALERWQLGNGLWEVAQFNERLQMARKRIGQTSAGQDCGVAADDELCLEWGYGSAATNNGNVMLAKQWSKKAAGGYLNLQSTFTYDLRNRLKIFNETVLSGGSSGGAWGQTNSYDRYGNRWATGTSQSEATPEQASRIDAATNRVVTALLGSGSGAIAYDAAGFMTSHPHVTGALSYDAEGRQVASGTSVYVYDGEGRRVKKVAGGVTTWFWYGADGSMVAEDTTEAQEGGRQYLHVDALGSTRLVTRSDKSVVSRMDYWPFGEEVAGTSLYGNRDLVSGYSLASAVKQRFTGKERDQENGLDYFGARYYAGVMGRWTSPDEFFGGPNDPIGNAPAAKNRPLPFADIQNPQSINKYGYVLSNPLRYTDPDGHCVSGFDTLLCLAAGGFVVHKILELVEAKNLVNEAMVIDEYYTGLLRRADEVCARGSSECAAAIEAAQRAQRSRHKKAVKAAIATAGIPGTVLGGPLTTGKVDTGIAGLVEPVMLQFQGSMNSEIEMKRKKSQGERENVRPKSPSEPLCLKNRDGKCIP